MRIKMDLHASCDLKTIRVEKGWHQRFRKKGKCKGRISKNIPQGLNIPLILRGLCTV
jgi:hypothetical protein